VTVSLLLATRNTGKLDELQRMLETSGVDGLRIVGLSELAQYPEQPETGATFEDNALAKARDATAATGLPSVADDSGLTVDALNGMPGVLSARWAGAHGDRDERDAANLTLVLDQLADVPEERRGAAFVCAAALVTPAGVEHVVRGEWRGTLTTAPRGSNGFGYDPIFVPDGQQCALRELGGTL
jgi:XTP/dITP diphosphohydrolase